MDIAFPIAEEFFEVLVAGQNSIHFEHHVELKTRESTANSGLLLRPFCFVSKFSLPEPHVNIPDT